MPSTKEEFMSEKLERHKQEKETTAVVARAEEEWQRLAAKRARKRARKAAKGVRREQQERD